LSSDTDNARIVYQALSLVEDAMKDGYKSGLPIPEIAEARALEGSVSTPAKTRRAPLADSLPAIAADAARCIACRLSAGRTRSVPGEGSSHPLVMVIGEGPGSEEDKTGHAFVGPAGQLLDKMLKAINLSRHENCFIGNIVKCRPPMNRDPAPDEQTACMTFLDRQLAILKPKAILAVGRIPAQALLGVKTGIGRIRGSVYDFRGIPLVATYHPSALLRDDTLKRPAWEDLKLLRAVLDDQES
jgi:DNA polymerase